jgi:hypothetical protein
MGLLERLFDREEEQGESNIESEHQSGAIWTEGQFSLEDAEPLILDGKSLITTRPDGTRYIMTTDGCEVKLPDQ